MTIFRKKEVGSISQQEERRERERQRQKQDTQRRLALLQTELDVLRRASN